MQVREIGRYVFMKDISLYAVVMFVTDVSRNCRSERAARYAGTYVSVSARGVVMIDKRNMLLYNETQIDRRRCWSAAA